MLLIANRALILGLLLKRLFPITVGTGRVASSLVDHQAVTLGAGNGHGTAVGEEFAVGPIGACKEGSSGVLGALLH